MLTSNDTDAMVADLRRLVECESPSMDIEATARCADLLAALGEERLGQAPERIRTGEIAMSGPSKELADNEEIKAAYLGG